MKLGICILVGGKSTRMKQSKADLIYQNQSFLDRLTTTFQDYEYKFISMNDKQSYHYNGYTNIIDEYDEIGPISGIVSTFHQSDVDALFVCSCDMPFIQKEVVDYLVSFLEGYDGVFLQDEQHTYMTTGIYTRSLLPVFESQIEKHRYGLYKTVLNQKIRTVPVLDAMDVRNINTIEEFQLLEG